MVGPRVDFWWGPDGRPILPPGLRMTALTEAHGTGQAMPGPSQKLPLGPVADQGFTTGEYFRQLQALVSAFSKQIQNQQLRSDQQPPPEVEWVLIRVIKRKWSETLVDRTR
ncbi:hypothetical protein DPEC_G00236740 [Dallia pectoralis]|uniref:Uncharacterized protein n=1 Tax=Dallia pectoralis TaxID=75939 RepID=A0ACC2FYU3_DALPE|nr:hypothetical protein DPEC_G00236740 [Dallia pectoralis]